MRLALLFEDAHIRNSIPERFYNTVTSRVSAPRGASNLWRSLRVALAWLGDFRVAATFVLILYHMLHLPSAIPNIKTAALQYVAQLGICNGCAITLGNINSFLFISLTCVMVTVKSSAKAEWI